MSTATATIQPKVESSAVYCPMCTHTVEAKVVFTRRKNFVKAGQKCPRCTAALDAAYVITYDRAA